jgi:hypothetical protein
VSIAAARATSTLVAASSAQVTSTSNTGTSVLPRDKSCGNKT